jgi:uncharacterized protein with HEPN domain
MSRDKETLLDIVTAAKLVVEFVQDMAKTLFVEDIKTQSAVLHQLLVIGEAVKRLSQDFRIQHPEIPFTLIAGMRDKLIHEYDDVDLDEVWKTAQRDVPKLLSHIESYIE